LESSTTIRSLAAIMLCIARLAFGDEPPRKQVQSETTDVIPIGPGGIIRLANSSGNLIIEGWDRQEVKVTVVKWIDHELESKQLPEAEQHLKNTSVTVEHPSADEVKISTAHPLRQVAIRYHIYAPRDSRIAVDHRGGYVLLIGLTGDINVASRNGDIVLMLPVQASYAIDAFNKLGVITADMPGTIKHKHIFGEQFTFDQQPRAAHHMRLRMGFGGITIKQVSLEGDASAFTSTK
jgi:hypothetical protein